MLVALSSTALVFKLLTDRLELTAPHGRRVTAVLLFQDLMVIPFALVLPSLVHWYTGSTHVTAGGGLRSLAVLGAVVVAFVGAQRAIPLLVRRASRADSREAFLFGTALVALGSAWLTGLAGLSPALGAFIAGLTLARSELREQIAADVLPLRDIFSSLFFVSIGALLQRDVVLGQPLLVFGGAAALIALKVVAAVAALRLGGASWRVAAAGAFALGQIGEFAFVLARTTGGADLMGPLGAPAFISAAVISLMLTPWLVARAPDWAIALDMQLSRRRPGAALRPRTWRRTPRCAGATS
jgi:CPA2 family monovalent cation:H+ antiporter-2